MENIRFTYIRNNRGVPFACIAWARSASGNVAHYGVSVLNESAGDKWHRKTARLIAAGKLTLEKFHAPATHDESTNGVLYNVMSAVCANSSVPSRARRGALQWLRRVDEKVEF